MIGLVIVAHGGLAAELQAAMEHVVGKRPGVMSISTEPDDDLVAKQHEIDAAVEAVDAGSGVAVITDMFGGTPCNLAIGASRSDSVEVIYGANLPMLVKLAKCGGVFERQANSLQSFLCRLRFLMPDWAQGFLENMLVNIFDWIAPKCWDDVDFKRGHPASSFAILFKFSLTGFKAAFNGFFDGKAACSSAFLGAVHNRVNAIT